jgi:simple sugar transport system ATP-binding protein
MVGRKMSKSEMLKRDDFIENASTLLNIENLKVDMPGEKVKNFSLEVKQGEILGIGGLAGGGKIGVSNGIMGLYPSEGNISKNGSPIALNSPVSSLNQKIAFVSEDRRGIGLLLDESIEMNIATTAIQIQDKFLKNSFSKSLSFYDNIAIRKHALELIKELDIRCTGPEQKARSLSGGNQQKVCIARAFTLEPEILFVSEPTRGIDVGAKQIVLDLLVKMNREHGVTIIMTSSELAELRKICDRIAIVAEGELAGILPPDAPDVKFGLMMAAKKEVIHHG